MAPDSEPIARGASEVDRLTTLVDLIRSLTSERDASEIVRDALLAATHVIPGADVGIIFLYDSARDKLTVSHAVGLGPEVYDIVIDPGEGLSGRAFESGHGERYPDEESVRRAMTTASSENVEIFENASHGIRFPQSALSAALVYKGKPIGAFVVENLRVPRLFQPFDLELVDALAQAAATAIVNARFYESQRQARLKLQALNEEVSRQRNDLERRLQIRESIAECLREGLALPALASRLMRVCQGDVVFLDALNRVHAADPSVDVELARGLRWTDWDVLSQSLERATITRAPQRLPINPDGELLVTPSVAGGELLGFVLLALTDRQLDVTDEAAVDSAALVAATEFLREQRAHEHTVRRQSTLLDQLLSGRMPTDGWSLPSLRPPLRAAVGVLQDDRGARQSPDVRTMRLFVALIQDVLESRGRLDLVVAKYDHVVVIRSVRDQDKRSLETDLRRVVTKVSQLLPSWRAVFAVAEPVQQITELADTHRDAHVTLRLGAGMSETSGVISIPDLGASRLVLRAASSEEAVDLCQGALRPVLEYDKERDGELLKTFRAYLHRDWSVKTAADFLNVHPHTVQYRLKRLQELSGLDLKDSDDRLTLELAVRILEANEAVVSVST